MQTTDKNTKCDTYVQNLITSPHLQTTQDE